jgi:hypothetical protein
MEKNDFPTTFLVPMLNDTELRDFVSIHRGNLLDKSGIKLRFQQLSDEGVYTIFGPQYMALSNDARTRKVDNKMQEVNSLIAVKNSLEGKKGIHFNISIYGHSTNEVLVQDEGPDQCTAYICESTYTPWADDIEILADKVLKFNVLARNHEVFKSVNKVVPVLAGHNWLPDTIARADAAKMWKVNTGGGSFQVIRGFATMARRVARRLL